LSSAIHKRESLQSWIDQTETPFVIAGPCSAENLEQVVATAKQLKETGKVSVFRAGAWKPRTRPGSFEGIGSKALEWMDEAKNQTGLSTITEVANAQHVEEVLKHNIDMLWLGARTTVNPFYVQEIAEALRGVDIPVLVKNPLHPDLGLWIGALERFDKVGINQLGAVHRGFYAHKPAPFRNEPRWDISFELRAKAPEIPILCDPSHIAGKREWIKEVSQTAMDINFDGLMIETHIDPDNAWSDASQQITPSALTDLLNNLVIRTEGLNNHSSEEKLEKFRKHIDGLDSELIKLLDQRKALIDKIGEIKYEDDMTIFQMQRWFEIMRNRENLADDLGVNKDLVNELFNVIHKYSVNQQIDLLKTKEKK
jgi:chorismate mutase